jgi:hypothetical protein
MKTVPVDSSNNAKADFSVVTDYWNKMIQVSFENSSEKVKLELNVGQERISNVTVEFFVGR